MSYNRKYFIMAIYYMFFKFIDDIVFQSTLSFWIEHMEPSDKNDDVIKKVMDQLLSDPDIQDLVKRYEEQGTRVIAQARQKYDEINCHEGHERRIGSPESLLKLKTNKAERDKVHGTHEHRELDDHENNQAMSDPQVYKIIEEAGYKNLTYLAAGSENIAFLSTDPKGDLKVIKVSKATKDPPPVNMEGIVQTGHLGSIEIASDRGVKSSHITATDFVPTLGSLYPGDDELRQRVEKKLEKASMIILGLNSYVNIDPGSCNNTTITKGKNGQYRPLVIDNGLARKVEKPQEGKNFPSKTQEGIRQLAAAIEYFKLQPDEVKAFPSILQEPLKMAELKNNTQDVTQGVKDAKVVNKPSFTLS
jgi:hypothetical protein